MRLIIPSETPTSADFSRATPGTYVNEAGIVRQAGVNQPRYQDGRLLLEAAASNLLQFSEDLRNTAEAGSTRPWGQFDDTGDAVLVAPVTTTKPDGASGSVSKLTANTTGALQRQVSQVVSGIADSAVVTFSVFIKSVEVPRVALKIGTKANTYPGATFDLSTGGISSSVAGVLSAGRAALAGGWWRCWVVANVSTGGTTPSVIAQLKNGSDADYSGAVGDGVYIWGAQLEVASAPSSYIPRLTAAAASRSADVLTDGYMASFEATAVGLPNQLVQEDASAAWVSGTTYAVDALVHRVETHRVYKRLVAGAGTTEPESDPTNWRDLRVTTRWAPLVMTEDTELLVIGNLHLSLPAGSSPGLYFGGIKASSIRTVVVKPDANLRSDRTHALPPAYAGWLSDGKASLYVDMSGEIYEGDRIDITLMQASVSGSAIGVAGLSYLISGIDYYLGETLQGARLGITDFSRRETDEFGTTTFVRRKFAKRLNVDVMLPTADLQRVFDLLTEMRGNVVLWVPGTSSELAPLSFFGWCKDFGLTVAYTRHATCALEIEGVI